MSKEQIARNAWPEFLDSFSRRHAGWPVTVDVRDPAIGRERQVEALPFAGVTAEHSGEVVLRMGTTTALHLTHTVSAPDEVWLERNSEGADRGLEISSNGAMTVIRFCLPMPAETVDSPFCPW